VKRNQFTLRFFSALIAVAMVLTVLPKKSIRAIELNPLTADGIVIKADEATIIEAEDWMAGGQDVAYHENTYETADVYKHPNAQRPADPNDSTKYVPQTKEDGLGGYIVSYATDPEWLKYEVTVEVEGDYAVAFYCARGYDGGALTLSVEGGASVSVPYTARTAADWSLGMTEGEHVLHLTAGEHVLKLDISWPWDIDYIQLTPVVVEEDDEAGIVHTIKGDVSTKIEAEDWMVGGQNVAYYEKSYETADVYKHPNAQRPADPADTSKYVPQTKDSGSGGYHVSYATDPEWIKYKVNVETEGDYLVAINCSRGYEGGALTLSVEGGASVSIPYTARTAADWSFGMTEGEYVLHLTAGEHVLKLDISWPWDIDYIELTPVAPAETPTDPTEEPTEAPTEPATEVVHNIAGEGTTKIEAEDWMAGGQDVAYHENTYQTEDVYKHPNAQRPVDPVDSSKFVPQTKEDGLGGYIVSYATDPEWLKYKINVQTEGDYLVAINAARGFDNGSLTVSVDGGDSVTLPHSARTEGNWIMGLTTGEYVLHLTAGEHVLKLAINWPWDIDYIQLTAVEPEEEPTTPPTEAPTEAPTEPATEVVHNIAGEGTTRIEAEDWMAGGQNVAYYEKSYETADVYKHPNAQRPADPADASKYVPQTKDSGSGGYHLSYATDPEWVKYKVVVETEGDYLVAINAARGFDNGSLTVSVDGGNSVTIPHTARAEGNWVFGMTTGEYVLHLTAGEHILKLAINWPWDIDYIELTAVDSTEDPTEPSEPATQPTEAPTEEPTEAPTAAPTEPATEAVHNIAGEGTTRIEAEDWMTGGQDVAYHENTYQTEDVYKHPNAQRPADPADSSKYVPQTKDFGSGGYHVSYAQDPEWIKYKVTVETEGDYLVAFNCARGYVGGGLTLSVEGGASVTVPYTARTEANWTLGMTEGEYVLHLTAGEHILKLDINWPWDIDYIELTAVDSTEEPTVPTEPATQPTEAPTQAPTQDPDEPGTETQNVIKGEGISKIEAENWMPGGQNVAYYEKSYETADVYKHPNAQRPVDPADTSKYVPQTKDSGSGGYHLSYATDPEWIKYKITVEEEGDYAVAFYCARGYEGGGLTITVDGGASVTVPYTARPEADWAFGLTEGLYFIHLTAGEHILKMDISWPWDIDYIQFTPASELDIGTPGDMLPEPNTLISNTDSTRVEAENWMNGGQGVAFNESTYQNEDVYAHPRAPRPGSQTNSAMFVPQTKVGGSGGYFVSYARDPEWIKYKITVESAGDYAVAVNCARGYEDGSLTISVDGGASVSIPYTARAEANWSLGMTEGEYILHLSAGEHILTLNIDWPWDIDYIEFTPVSVYVPENPGDVEQEPITTIIPDGISKIEAEDWMNGGPGVAFEDDDYTEASTYQHPRAPRPISNSNLVPQTRFIGEGNYIITHIQDPDWMAYKINVTESGTYRFSAMCGSTWSPGNISFYLDDNETAIATISASTLPSFDWNLALALGGYAELPAGEHILKVVFFGVYDLDYVQIEPYTATGGDGDEGPTTVITGEGLERLEAEDWMGGGQGVAYQEVNFVTSYDEEHWRYAYDHPRAPKPELNDPLIYVPQTFKLVDRFYIDGVEQNRTDENGEFVLAYTEEPEWIKYRVYIEKAGTYQVDAMACTAYDSIIMCMYDGDEEVAIISTINNGWDHYNLCEGGKYYFTEGEHILTVKFFGGSDTNYFQFQWLSAEPPAEEEDNGPIAPEEEETLPELDGPITVDKNALNIVLDNDDKTMTLPRNNVTVYEVLYALYLEDGVSVKFFDANGTEITNMEMALTEGTRMAAYRNGTIFEIYSIVIPVDEAPEDPVDPPTTEPEATEPEATEPEATEPPATEPEATEPSDDTDTPEDDKEDLPADTSETFFVLMASMIAAVSLYVLILLAKTRARKEQTF